MLCGYGKAQARVAFGNGGWADGADGKALAVEFAGVMDSGIIPAQQDGQNLRVACADIETGVLELCAQPRSPAPTNSSSGPPEPPFNRFPSRTARASFLAPDTLHNKWKCSSLELRVPAIPGTPRKPERSSGRKMQSGVQFSQTL